MDPHPKELVSNCTAMIDDLKDTIHRSLISNFTRNIDVCTDTRVGMCMGAHVYGNCLCAVRVGQSLDPSSANTA